MYITRASVEDFGKFHNEEIVFQPGLNLVYGANEAGKSTLQDFIVGMLYGIDKRRGPAARTDQYTLRKPYDRPGFSGRLEVYSDGRAYQIERNFLQSEKTTRVIDMESGREEALLKPHSIEGTLLKIDRQTYANTLCIDSVGAQTDKELTERLKKRMINMSTARAAQIDQSRAISILKEKKKNYRTRELIRQAKQMAQELYQEDHYDERLDDITKEYQRLDKRLEMARQKQTDIHELYHVKKTKPGEKKITILAVTALLLAALCTGIYFLPVSEQARLFFWVGSVLVVFYMLVSAFAQKGRYLRTQKRKQHKKQQEYEASDAIERSEITYYTEQLAYLRAKEEEIQKQKKEKEAKWAEYDTLKAQIDSLNTEAKAISLAISTIERLAGTIAGGYGSTLNRKVSKMMAQITRGRYQQVFVGENLEIQVLDNGRYVSLEYLSTGTKQQIYFCLRMAAAEMLGCPAMPLMLDDIFITYDEERLQHALEFLADYKENQIILFTANPQIADMFDGIGRDYNYIELQQANYE